MRSIVSFGHAFGRGEFDTTATGASPRADGDLDPGEVTTRSPETASLQGGQVRHRHHRRQDEATEDAGKLDAISRSQAMIEFTPAARCSQPTRTSAHARLSALRNPGPATTACSASPVIPARPNMPISGAPGPGRIHLQRIRALWQGRQRRSGSRPPTTPFAIRTAVYKVLKFATDVTERMAAINALEPACERLRRRSGSIARHAPSFPAWKRWARIQRSACRLSGHADGRRKCQPSPRPHAIPVCCRRSVETHRQQAASVEETAAALHEITTTVAASAAEPRKRQSGRKDEGWRRALRTLSSKARSAPWARSSNPRAKSATSSASSTTSPSRRTCWPSMPVSRRRVPEKPARVRRRGPGGPRTGAAIGERGKGHQIP